MERNFREDKKKLENTLKNYMNLWVDALAESELKGSTKGVARWIADYADFNNGTGIWVAIATIAKRSGYGKATVERAIKELAQEGFLTLVKAGKAEGKTNLWNCTIPVRVHQDEVGVPQDEVGVHHSDGGVHQDDAQTLNNTHLNPKENKQEEDLKEEKTQGEIEEKTSQSSLASSKNTPSPSLEVVKEDAPNDLVEERAATEYDELAIAFINGSEHAEEALKLFLDPAWEVKRDPLGRAKLAITQVTPVKEPVRTRAAETETIEMEW